MIALESRAMPEQVGISSEMLKGRALRALHRCIDRAAVRKCSKLDVDGMMGEVHAAYLCCAVDPTIRAGAASGGAVTALLVQALETGRITGAVVCASEIRAGKVRGVFRLARTRGEIVAARSSKYVATTFLKDVLPILRNNEGRFAVCGLPCDLAALRRHETASPELARKIAMRVGLFCGHNSRPELVDAIVSSLRPDRGDVELRSFTFREGHWRGSMVATYSDGSRIARPFSTLSDYRNLYLFAQRKCLGCHDHFAYASDISAGDVWLYGLKERPHKYTGILCRSAEAAGFLVDSAQARAVHAEPTSSTVLLAGQSRVAPFHYNTAARARVARWFGIHVPPGRGGRTGALDLLAAAWTVAAVRFSESPYGGAVLRVPRLLVRGAVLARKCLETVI